MTALQKTLPNFLVMGVPKSGTTSLYHYLKAHPDIFLPHRKELHYFTAAQIKSYTKGPGDARVAAGLIDSFQDYQSYYQGHLAEAMIGDVSPSYFYFTECYQSIKQLLGPHTKLVIALRNPVDRAFSNYQHLVNAGREKLSFIEALGKEEERKQAGYGDFWRYTEHSLYAKKLTLLFEIFPHENIHIISFQDLQNTPQKVITELYGFLGIDPDFESNNQHIIYGKGGNRPRGWWMSLFTKSAYWKQAFKKVVPNKLLQQYRKKRDEIIAEHTVQLQRLDEASYHYLAPFFEQDQIDMKEQFGIDLGFSQYYQS